MSFDSFKMKKKSTILIIISIVCLSSCTYHSNRTKESKGTGLYEVDLDNVTISPDDLFLTSSVYKGIRTILLETNESCLIGAINKMRVYDNFILILDRGYARSLYVFDKDGRFIRKIGGVGGGPGEYTEATDFTIDKDNNTAYLLDRPGCRINKYDIITGRFMHSINLNPSAHSICIEYLGGKLYTDASFGKNAEEHYLLREIDESTGKEEFLLNVKEYHKGIGYTLGSIQQHVFFLRANGNIVFFQQFMDQIMEISKDGISSLISFKGKDMLTSEEIKRVIEKDPLIYNLFELNPLRKYLELFGFFEQTDCFHFSYCKGGMPVRFRIDKQTNEVSLIMRFRDDLLTTEKYYGPIPNLECYDSNGVYYYVPQHGMQLFIASAKEGGLQPNLDRLEEIKNLEEDANPVIFYYEFK